MRVDESLPSSSAAVLVTGATGYIGRHLIGGLVQQGTRVRAFTRGATNLFHHYGSAVEVFKGSPASDADLGRALRGVRVVFHLARANERTWEGFKTHDVGFTKRLIEVAGASGIERVIYTGSIAAYDASRSDGIITEETTFASDAQLQPYARAKKLSEEILLAAWRSSAFPVVIVRPGIVVGADGPLMHWGVAHWSSSTACTMWDNGQHPMPFVAINDLVQGLIATMNRQGIEGESFNLVGDPVLSALDYLENVRRRCGLALRIKQGRPASFFLGEIATTAAKVVLLRKYPSSGPSLTQWAARTHRARYSNTKAKNQLDWVPIADKQTLIEAVINPLSLVGIDTAKREYGLAGRR